jgi:hypothetical protein
MAEKLLNVVFFIVRSSQQREWDQALFSESG